MRGFDSTEVGSGVLSSLAGGTQWLKQNSRLSNFGEYYIIVRIFWLLSWERVLSKIKLSLPMHLQMWDSQ